MSPRDVDDLQVVAGYLARRDTAALDPVGRWDVLVLCGSAVLASLDVAADAVHRGAVGSVLVSGGVGHSTPHLRAAVRASPRHADVDPDGRTEASVLAELLRHHHDVPAALVATEEESTNCGENAAFSLRVLARRRDVGTVLLVQDPTMQRRTHASFDHHQRDAADPLGVTSLAPFVPVVRADGVGPADGGTVWDADRFTELALGEVRRLRDDERGYGPRGAGFLGHVDVPAEVLAAADRLATRLPHLAGR